MDTNDKGRDAQKGANDKIHSLNLGETIDSKNLAYDKDKNSFEIDVESDNKDYNHPLPYDTTAANGGDENSDYDEANPYIGDEYASKEDQVENDLETMGMHIDDGEIVALDAEDEFLAKTPEDERSDLDEEGYPKNDAPPLP